MTYDKYTIGIAQPTPQIILIENSDTGCPLLSIHPDGTVTGEIENASEAARVFFESLRGYLRQPTQTDALKKAREALERIEAATRNEVRAGDKGYVSRYGIHGIARAALDAVGLKK
jgi:hypothetical protein